MLKLQNEQWFLVAALVLGGGLLAFLGFSLSPLDPLPQGRVNNPPAFDPAPYQQAAEKLLHPVEVKDGEHKVFVSRLVVYYPQDQTVKALNPADKDPSGITIQWKIDNKFPIDDPSVASSDPDNDGFSNLEEFTAHTKANDSASRPPLVLKLRVESYTKVPFRVILKGYNPDATTGQMLFQLNLLDVKTNKTRMVKEGDTIEGYKVGAFRKNIVKRPNPRTGIVEEIDESELDLINLKLDETITLVRNVQKDSDESFVQLRVDSPVGKVEPPRVVRGEKFKLDGKEYQLLKPGEKTVTIKDLQSGQVLEGIGG
ncbi:MAG: Amuc_1099 family pilus-like system protein [Candidatus Methylacidiphilales bacterium]|nr:Amuc_1099 family pilus-like system protein [Candidatus Methylacidiphilales bacterium]